MKKISYFLVAFFVIFSFVVPVLAAGFTFLPNSDGDLVCDSFLVPGSYQFSCVFLNGFSGVGLSPCVVSYDDSGVSPELSFEAEILDGSGQSLGVQSGTFYLGYDVTSGCTFLISGGGGSLPISSALFVPVSSVPDVSTSDLMADVASLFSGNFNVHNLLIVIAAALGVSVGLVLLWFGFGYIKEKLLAALRKGRV